MFFSSSNWFTLFFCRKYPVNGLISKHFITRIDDQNAYELNTGFKKSNVPPTSDCVILLFFFSSIKITSNYSRTFHLCWQYKTDLWFVPFWNVIRSWFDQFDIKLVKPVLKYCLLCVRQIFGCVWVYTTLGYLRLYC